MDIDKETPGEVWDTAHFNMDMPSKWDFSSFCLEDKEVLGFLIGSLKSDLIHIHRLVVHKNFRNHGIGKMFIEDLEDKVNAAGLKGITLKVATHNPNAIRFYQRLGFESIGLDKKDMSMKKLLIPA